MCRGAGIYLLLYNNIFCASKCDKILKFITVNRNRIFKSFIFTLSLIFF